jgi:hypothetical protein
MLKQLDPPASHRAPPATLKAWEDSPQGQVRDASPASGGRYMPTPAGAAADLSWPDYADSEVARIRRSVTLGEDWRTGSREFQFS